eukprot:gene4970-biopygen2769
MSHSEPGNSDPDLAQNPVLGAEYHPLLPLFWVQDIIRHFGFGSSHFTVLGDEPGRDRVDVAAPVRGHLRRHPHHRDVLAEGAPRAAAHRVRHHPRPRRLPRARDAGEVRRRGEAPGGGEGEQRVEQLHRGDDVSVAGNDPRPNSTLEGGCSPAVVMAGVRLAGDARLGEDAERPRRVRRVRGHPVPHQGRRARERRVYRRAPRSPGWM